MSRNFCGSSLNMVARKPVSFLVVVYMISTGFVFFIQFIFSELVARFKPPARLWPESLIGRIGSRDGNFNFKHLIIILLEQIIISTFLHVITVVEQYCFLEVLDVFFV